MGFGEHQPFGCVRWRHARLQATEQTAGPGRWKIPPGMQPRCSACWVDRSQVRGTSRQPGSRRELAGASQLSCPHSDSRILSSQASRQDKDLREACGGLLGPWSFSEVTALGGGLFPVPQPSEWSREHCLHGQAGRALAGVVGRMSLCLLLLAASFHLVTLGGHAPAQASLCSSGTVGLASWKGTKPAQQTWEVQAAGLQDLGRRRTRPGATVLEARVAAFVPACSWLPSHHGHSLPISLEALPKAWSCFLECLPTNILILLVGPGGAFGTEETLLWLCQVSCSQPACPSNRSHLGPSDLGGPPCQAWWTHAPPEGFPEGMTH